jgi:hypothetical protein
MKATEEEEEEIVVIITKDKIDKTIIKEEKITMNREEVNIKEEENLINIQI